MARKGHGQVRLLLAGGFVFAPLPKADLPVLGGHMFSDYAKDRIIEVIAVVELSLILVGFMFYYLFLLPQQQNRCKANGSGGVNVHETKTKS